LIQTREKESGSYLAVYKKPKKNNGLLCLSRVIVDDTAIQVRIYLTGFVVSLFE
jgi:hypothetical protein